MSAKESEEKVFLERDDAETRMDFDQGGIPFYVAIAWIIFLAAYVIYMVIYALPDWKAWTQL
ncbi:MAG: hypothetical protein D6812_12235 [Deltaproteobacteria bacterium]|nr:MAG: hypothetical protein D6812_12235 [Deltaproteobacteria bacterium]RME45087.1 MAG: hypothetical protein D6795_17085 [Deltaproteobacteria bacterium]